MFDVKGVRQCITLIVFTILCMLSQGFVSVYAKLGTGLRRELQDPFNTTDSPQSVENNDSFWIILSTYVVLACALIINIAVFISKMNLDTQNSFRKLESIKETHLFAYMLAKALNLRMSQDQLMERYLRATDKLLFSICGIFSINLEELDANSYRKLIRNIAPYISKHKAKFGISYDITEYGNGYFSYYLNSSLVLELIDALWKPLAKALNKSFLQKPIIVPATYPLQTDITGRVSDEAAQYFVRYFYPDVWKEHQAAWPQFIRPFAGNPVVIRFILMALELEDETSLIGFSNRRYTAEALQRHSSAHVIEQHIPYIYGTLWRYGSAFKDSIDLICLLTQPMPVWVLQSYFQVLQQESWARYQKNNRCPTSCGWRKLFNINLDFLVSKLQFLQWIERNDTHLSLMPEVAAAIRKNHDSLGNHFHSGLKKESLIQLLKAVINVNQDILAGKKIDLSSQLYYCIGLSQYMLEHEFLVEHEQMRLFSESLQAIRELQHNKSGARTEAVMIEMT